MQRLPAVSQLCYGVSPSRIHLHCDLVPLSRAQEPLTSSVDECPPLLPPAPTDGVAEMNVKEKDAFAAWLLRRWEKKDALLNQYYRDGDFVHGQSVPGRSEEPRGVEPPLLPTPRMYVPMMLAPPSVLSELGQYAFAISGLLLAVGYGALCSMLYTSLAA